MDALDEEKKGNATEKRGRSFIWLRGGEKEGKDASGLGGKKGRTRQRKKSRGLYPQAGCVKKEKSDRGTKRKKGLLVLDNCETPKEKTRAVHKGKGKKRS